MIIKISTRTIGVAIQRDTRRWWRLVSKFSSGKSKRAGRRQAKASVLQQLVDRLEQPRHLLVLRDAAEGLQRLAERRWRLARHKGAGALGADVGEVVGLDLAALVALEVLLTAVRTCSGARRSAARCLTPPPTRTLPSPLPYQA